MIMLRLIVMRFVMVMNMVVVRLMGRVVIVFIVHIPAPLVPPAVVACFHPTQFKLWGNTSFGVFPKNRLFGAFIPSSARSRLEEVTYDCHFANRVST
jgi:hypothetical protein